MHSHFNRTFGLSWQTCFDLRQDRLAIKNRAGVDGLGFLQAGGRGEGQLPPDVLQAAPCQVHSYSCEYFSCIASEHFTFDVRYSVYNYKSYFVYTPEPGNSYLAAQTRANIH
jgi:hypothetical protein